jgi:hypothetical protein
MYTHKVHVRDTRRALRRDVFEYRMLLGWGRSTQTLTDCEHGFYILRLKNPPRKQKKFVLWPE